MVLLIKEKKTEYVIAIMRIWKDSFDEEIF